MVVVGCRGPRPAEGESWTPPWRAPPPGQPHVVGPPPMTIHYLSPPLDHASLLLRLFLLLPLSCRLATSTQDPTQPALSSKR